MKKIAFLIMRRAAVLGISSCFLTVSSCSRQKESITPLSGKLFTETELNANRLEFTKILAKAVADEDVRKLLKSEAAKQFDKDYDVLFQAVKNTEIRSGVTFSSYLQSLSPSKERFNTITESLPLLTILVPDLPQFSANKWDVAAQIPLVVVRNNDFKKDYKLPAFMHTGEETISDAKV